MKIGHAIERHTSNVKENYSLNFDWSLLVFGKYFDFVIARIIRCYEDYVLGNVWQKNAKQVDLVKKTVDKASTTPNKSFAEMNLILHERSFADHDRIVLEVPFSEKDQVKALGAKWNGQLKKWCINSQHNISHFQKWLPTSQHKGGKITLKHGIYLLHSWERCYKCGAIADVFCLAADGVRDENSNIDVDGFFTISFLTFASEKMVNLFRRYTPTYYMDYTKQSGMSYYVNHCKCGAKLGDHYLHHLEGAFLPMSEDEAEHNIVKHDILTTQLVKVDAVYVTSDIDFHVRIKKGNQISL